MNIMNIPGFTANASLYERNWRYRSKSKPSFANEAKHNLVYMQKPNSQNTPGGSCYGFTSGTLITGTYDSLGRCCIRPANGFPYCIDCDTDKCYDKQSVILGGTFTSGNLYSGVFARF
jgi:hypothetical protein